MKNSLKPKKTGGNLKKNLLIIALIFGLSLQLLSQTTNDQKEVIEKVLSLIEFQEHAHYNSYGELTLVILDNNIILSSHKLIHFENPVEFIKKEELQANNIVAYLEFVKVDFTNDRLVQVIYKYVITGEVFATRLLLFEKKSDQWELI